MTLRFQVPQTAFPETLCNSAVGNINSSEGEWKNDGKTSEYYVGSKRTLKCKPGYHNEGTPLTVTCQENGNWTRTSATCQKTFCNSAVDNISSSEGEWENDSKTNEYNVGTKKTLKCKAGYHSEGAPLTVTCQENGNWTKTSATCEKTFCNPVVGNISLSEGEWESDDNISENSVGMKRMLKCRPGYHSEGMPLIVICQKNGKWTRISASCKKDKPKSHLAIISKTSWSSQKKCKSDLKFIVGQILHQRFEENPEKDNRILGNFIQIKIGKTTWHFRQKHVLESVANDTRHRHIEIEEKPQMDHKILAIVVGSVVALIILISIGVKIFLISRKKPLRLSVVFKPGGNNSSSVPVSAADRSAASLNEAENSAIHLMQQSEEARQDFKIPPLFEDN